MKTQNKEKKIKAVKGYLMPMSHILTTQENMCRVYMAKSNIKKLLKQYPKEVLITPISKK